MTPIERLYSPTEASEITGFHRQVIYRAVRRGELHAFRICGRIRIKAGDLEAWIEREPVQSARCAIPDLVRATRPHSGDSLRLLRNSKLERGGA
jgi:excisionase family DNA binding protein